MDFHTSPAIEGIGTDFDKKEFQDALMEGHVNSMTCFSSCHHGWSYHPTEAGAMHPHLNFDLLRAQIEACREIDVKVPVYLTAGVDNYIAEKHPEWREIDPDGTLSGWVSSPLEAGFKTLCFNSPYLDYLCLKIEEVVRRYPEADGIFLDIIMQAACCCPYCMDEMDRNGLDPRDRADRLRNAKAGLKKYYQRTTAAVKGINPDMPVFHNSGNIPMGRRDVFQWFSHQELESLPTGGWGYDHFPLTAKYAAGIGQEYLGMTGKFHTTWGEFGGFKTADALRYECAAMLALGAKCSIGDQLHPTGRMDSSTYRIIGKAYKEVEEKEPWCGDVKNIADIGLLSCVANKERLSDLWDPDNRDLPGDVGASRVLLEGHYLFDVIDDESDFNPYKVLILPDEIKVDSFLKEKLEDFLDEGGKLLMSGDSGLDAAGSPVFDIGGEVQGLSPYSPDFILPEKPWRSPDIDTPLVMYVKSRRLKVLDGQCLGHIYDPYFNRSYDHFCSHQHAPAKPEHSGFSCGVRKGNVMYLPHKVFSLYRSYGVVAHRMFIENVLRGLLDQNIRIRTNLPSTARLFVQRQEKESRTVIHLLYGNTVNRGGGMDLVGGVGGDGFSPRTVEVIEELIPLRNVELSYRSHKPSKIFLEPQHEELEDSHWSEGDLHLKIDSFSCHQMIVVED